MRRGAGRRKASPDDWIMINTITDNNVCRVDLSRLRGREFYRSPAGLPTAATNLQTPSGPSEPFDPGQRLHEIFSIFIALKINAVSRERSMPSQPLEWPYKKFVFVTLLCMAYAAALMALLYPFFMYSLG